MQEISKELAKAEAAQRLLSTSSMMVLHPALEFGYSATQVEDICPQRENPKHLGGRSCSFSSLVKEVMSQ